MVEERFYPLTPTDLRLKKDLGSDASVNELTAHTKLDNIKATADATLNDTADMQPKLGLPVSTISGDIAVIDANVDSIKVTVEDTNTHVNDGTHGLATLRAREDIIEAKIDVVDNELEIVDQNVDDIEARLGTPTSGTIASHVENVEALIGAPTYGDVSADIANIESKVSQIQNNTRTTIGMSQEMEIPETGSSYYKLSLNNYDTAGNMEDPDSAPTVNVENTDSSVSLNANLGNWDGSTFTQGTAMAKESDGRYYIYYKVSSADPQIQVLFTFTIIEGGVTRYIDRTAKVVDEIHNFFTVTDRATIVDTNVKTTDIQTKVGVPTHTTLSGDHDALETLGDNIEAKVDIIDANVDNVKDVMLPEMRTTTTGTFNRDTMSLEAIADELSVTHQEARLSMFKATKTSGSIASGASETVLLDEASGVSSPRFLVKELRVIPTTACNKYTVEIYEDASLNDLLIKVEDWKYVVDGDLRLMLDLAFFSTTSTKNAYVRITNDDNTAITFDVELRAVIAY